MSEEIRKLLRARPLEPWRVILDNGERHRIMNIEALAIGPDSIHMLDSRGDWHYVAPEAVSEMRPLRGKKSKRNA